MSWGGVEPPIWTPFEKNYEFLIAFFLDNLILSCSPWPILDVNGEKKSKGKKSLIVKINVFFYTLIIFLLKWSDLYTNWKVEALWKLKRYDMTSYFIFFPFFLFFRHKSRINFSRRLSSLIIVLIRVIVVSMSTVPHFVQYTSSRWLSYRTCSSVWQLWQYSFRCLKLYSWVVIFYSYSYNSLDS